MLKFTFIGWKFSIRPSLIYRPNAPIAVSCGKTGKTLPCTLAAMATLAKKPEAALSTYPSTPVICPAKATSGLRRSA